MSTKERPTLPTDGNGLLSGSRTRSYGSLVKSSVSPAREKLIEHTVQLGETLQGLALKYGVSMEQIKRANRLYTNDSIFLKKALYIPVRSDSEDCVEDLFQRDLDDHTTCASGQNGKGSLAVTLRNCRETDESDLSPMDFLKRMDCLIRQSKNAAVKGCHDGEKRCAAIEADCDVRVHDGRCLTRSQRSVSSQGVYQQHAALVAVPLTITRHTRNLREREDEIFQL